ncbi:unnamed protein product [Coregonus sp. 'balchen']|nr:unnamed protein product [Coregonus sp. 'balchen']
MYPSPSSLLLLMVSSSWAAHFYGGTMTFNPRGSNPDGSYRVDLRYKTGFHSCTFSDTWVCVSGDCGTRTSLAVQTVDQETSGAWCQTEGLMTRHVSNNTHTFDLRSDTGKANRSPQTTVIPLMRVPVNCHRDFNLLSFDPDGDTVRCRDAVPTDECVTSSNLPGVDFTLRGVIDPVVPSCTEGVYIPMFLSPTPAQGALLYASADHPLEITVRAQATNSVSSYQSELRCVIISVNSRGYIVGLRMKLSSLTPLTDDYIREMVLQQLREELIRRGLSGNVTLRLRATQEISP